MGKKGKYRQPEEEEPKKKKMMLVEEHLMDKTHMDTTEFQPFLPEDSLYPPYQINTRALHIILRDLNYLLYVDFKTFWATLLYNPTLKICLCSCLQNLHRNWLNQYRTKPNEQQQSDYDRLKFTQKFELTQGIMKVVLFIYYRMMKVEEQNKDLSELYKLQQQISNKYLFDIPRMLELIQIYGKSNKEIVHFIIKAYTSSYRQAAGTKYSKSSALNAFYSQFVEDIMNKLIQKMNRNIFLLKKISDRQEFGIEYSYKRTIVGQLSAGEEEFQRKITLLLSVISFFQTINNVIQFFPQNCSDYVQCNQGIHSIVQNVFIQIQQAYKKWSNQDMGHRLYPLMNKILVSARNYFIDYFKMCEGIMIKKSIKTSVLGSYIKCFDRIIENYGRRESLGKKASATKRYMELYSQIIKQFDLNDFLTKIYIDETENQVHGINIQYLVDFKLAIEELVIKMKGIQHRPEPYNDQDEGQTQVDMEGEQMIEQEPVRKISSVSNLSKMGEQQGQYNQPAQQNIDKLEVLIHKKDREQDYYQKLYKDYRTKIVIDYDDEYDDLIDFEKRPMFEDDANNREGSSDGSSAQFDSQQQKLHLVKSVSNVNRGRVHLQSNDNQEKKQRPNDKGFKNQRGAHKEQYKGKKKYQRKDKVKYVPVKQKEATQMIEKYSKKTNNQQEMKVKKQKNNQYDDEQCYQQCKAKIKYEQKQIKNQEEKQQNKHKVGEQGKRVYQNSGQGKSKNYEEGKKNKPKYVAKN